MTSQKRCGSPILIPNPFIKKRNLEWNITAPDSDCQKGEASENSQAVEHKQQQREGHPSDGATGPTTAAAIESGRVIIHDHLARFTTLLSKYTSILPRLPHSPRFSLHDYKALYEANSGSARGAHFVIHQHDHPIAGTHYDLRLQINETSSASWAIMYGVPGDPNSMRPNRNATETRVHSLWNHLIETASADTGSLLIWDTGSYSILPRRSKRAPATDPSSPPASPPSPSSSSGPTQQSLLHKAFQDRKIKLQLHGSKLPDPYVLNLRLTKGEDAAGRARSLRVPRKRRRRGVAAKSKNPHPETACSSDDGSHAPSSDEDSDDIVDPATQTVEASADVSAEDRELRELEDAEVRRTNAYVGASNTIGSIHQRRWYLSLDRAACGFVKNRLREHVVWQLDPNTKSAVAAPEHDLSLPSESRRMSYPFYVRGRDCERSIITDRTGLEILRDEGVEDFVPRMGWTPVVR